MKKKLKYSLVIFFITSLVFQSCIYAFAATEATTETTQAESTEFQWDDENIDNAMFTWEGNDWGRYQDRLTLSGYISASGHADVDNLVRNMENVVKNVLDSEETNSNLADYSKSKYKELILAIIEVLAENDGIISSEENPTQAEFDEWTKTMGKYVSPTYTGEWTTEKSIQQIFYRFTYSASLYQAHNTSENGDNPQVSPLKIDQPFLIVLEGVVMHGVSGDTYYSYIMRDSYSKHSALSWYNTHKEAIDLCYQNAGLTDYEPDEAFAAKVKSIYSISEGYGEGAVYASSAPNDKVEDVLAYLDKQNGKPYVWGASGPNSFDCSGLVYAALKNTNAVPGIERLSTGDFPGSHFYRQINENELKPGDILWKSGHVAFFLGRTEDGNYNTFEAKGVNYGVGYFTRRKASMTKYFRWW